MIKKNKKQKASILSYPSKCMGCLICELSCSLNLERAFNIANAAIQIRRLVDQEEEFSISFNEKCTNCGICARFCLHGALVWQKENV